MRNLAPTFRLSGFLALIVSFTGCAHQPDPLAPTVMSDPISMTCPPPAKRVPPANLMALLGMESPDILKKGEGDYGITRADLEKVIEAMRKAATRIAEMKAWASPTDRPEEGFPTPSLLRARED